MSNTPESVVERVAVAEMPTEFGRFQIVAYRAAHKEPVALIAAPLTNNPLVRLHSECLTGDALSSQRCDCGPQLRTAQQLLANEGGILIYLRQEGRGIGLANKIRAYALQDTGLDTLDANLHLGFGADERDYTVAAAILQDLDHTRIRLLTNNPLKVAGLEGHGITVSERISLEIAANPHNHSYLTTKRDRMDHALPSLNGLHPK